MNILMDSFWMGFAAGVMVGGFFGLLAAGLAHYGSEPSDAEERLDRHLEELDEFERSMADEKAQKIDPFRPVGGIKK